MRERGPKYVKNTAETQAPSSGLLLSEVIRKRKINTAALARIMKRHYSTVSAYSKNGSIQTSILWEISTILKHNFFADLAALMPPEFEGAKDKVIAAKDAEIATLKEALTKAEGERDLLMRVIGK